MIKQNVITCTGIIKGTIYRSVDIDQEKVRPGQWLGLVLCISYSAFTLTVGWLDIPFHFPQQICSAWGSFFPPIDCIRAITFVWKLNKREYYQNCSMLCCVWQFSQFQQCAVLLVTWFFRLVYVPLIPWYHFWTTEGRKLKLGKWLIQGTWKAAVKVVLVTVMYEKCLRQMEMSLCATGQKASHVDWLQFWCTSHIFVPWRNGKA